MKRGRIIFAAAVLLLLQSMAPELAFSAVKRSAAGITVTQSGDQKQTGSAVKTVYSCPMHPEVVRDSQGKCPKCGMELKKKEVAKDEYTCPMHPEVLRDKEGKCPKCGCSLVKKTAGEKSTSSR